MRKALALVSVFLFVLLFGGCAYSASGLSDATTPLTSGQYQTLGRAEGSSEYISILAAFPLGRPDYDAAIRDAVSKYPNGKALVNVRSYSRMLYLYVLSINTLTVEGDVVTW